MVRLRINPDPWPVNNGTRAIHRGPSAAAEVTTLAVASSAGALVGGMVGRSRRSAGIGAALGFGIAIALIATAEED